MPGQVSQLLNETVIAVVAAADVAAGTAFAAVNLSTQGGGQIWIDGFDAGLQFGTDPDIATLDDVRVQIIKNVGPVNPALDINPQISSGVLKHFAQADARQVRVVHREFTSPTVLDRGYNYVVLCTFFMTAAITTTAAIRLTVKGRNLSDDEAASRVTIYGAPR